MTSKLDGRPWKIIEHLLELYYAKLCASLQIHQWIKSWVTVQKHSIQVKIGDFFVPCDLIIWQMTLKNNRAPLLGCFNLCALFYFIAISEFKQELQSGNGGGGGGGGNQPWPSRPNLTWKSKFTTFWACPHHNTLPVQQSGTKPNLVAKALATNFGVFFTRGQF